MCNVHVQCAACAVCNVGKRGVGGINRGEGERREEERGEGRRGGGKGITLDKLFTQDVSLLE